MGLRQESFLDYDGFVTKFNHTKTTDDCYTPLPVYNAVLAWVRTRYNLPADALIMRPFRPQGDYECEVYPPNAVVVDNPPFSIVTKICKFYQARKIPFFLFAPKLTLFTSLAVPGVGAVVIYSRIVYENGAAVATSFLTNLPTANLVEVAIGLDEELARLAKAKRASLKAALSFPPAVLRVLDVEKYARRHIPYTVPFGGAIHITSGGGTDIFGSGLLLSKRQEAARRSTDAAWEKSISLTPRELQLQSMMGDK